jgi:uncharacterized delta-60 repeat protein
MEALERRYFLSSSTSIGVDLFAVDIAGGSDMAVTAAVQPDGKTVVAGWCQVASGDIAFTLTRLNADKSIDTSFGDNGLVALVEGSTDRNAFNHLKILDDGSILAYGDFFDQQGDHEFGVRKFHADGSIDTSFGDDGRALVHFGSGRYDELGALDVDAQGRLVLAGGSGFPLVDGDPTQHDYSDIALARLTADGQLDTTFGNDGKVLLDLGSAGDHSTESASTVKVLSDGSILIGGNDSFPSNNSAFLMKFTADGAQDHSFGQDGIAQLDTPTDLSFVTDMEQQSDGKIIALVSRFEFKINGNEGKSIPESMLCRVNPDGTLDDIFANGIVVDSADIIGAPLPPAGRVSPGSVVVAGDSQDRLHIAADGTIDVAFVHDRFYTTFDAQQQFGPEIGLARFDSNGTLISRDSHQYPLPSSGNEWMSQAIIKPDGSGVIGIGDVNNQSIPPTVDPKVDPAGAAAVAKQWEDYHNHDDALIADFDAPAAPSTNDPSSPAVPAPASQGAGSMFCNEPVASDSLLTDRVKDPLTTAATDPLDA